MRISVIGTGNVGSVLASRFTETGHDVTVANTSTAVAEVAAQATAADLVVLAIPFDAVAHLDDQVKAAMAGKTVVDATNPLAADFMSLTVGHHTSGGEQVATALPGATVVKAFNSLFAANLGRPELGGGRLFLPVAGDDDAAKKTVVELGTQLGFDAVDAGPLANARYIEPAIELIIQLAYGQGMGGDIGLALARG